ncbi:hypothetical protein F5Y03DRAFT_355902 [Xylaria venustula]|nr:hypothetical protein F5Y03DRAFT_355902 [Xylaria venustula]
MSYLLEEVKDPDDFGEIIPMLHDGFQEPHNPLHRWFMPLLITVEATVENKIQKTVKHSQLYHVHWLKVTHVETGEIVGAAEWEIREHVDNRGEPQEAIDASWFPQGSEERIFAGKLVTSLKSFMKKRMTRPHAELAQLVVAQAHRKRGVVRLLVEWGKQKADDLEIESCVESVPLAVRIYEKLGYGSVDCLQPDVTVPHPSDAYKEYIDDYSRV